MVDFVSDRELLDDEIEVRGCRYKYEVPKTPFHNYSVSICKYKFMSSYKGKRYKGVTKSTTAIRLAAYEIYIFYEAIHLIIYTSIYTLLMQSNNASD